MAYGSYGIFSVISLSYLLPTIPGGRRSLPYLRGRVRYVALLGLVSGVVIGQSRSTIMAATLVVSLNVGFYLIDEHRDLIQRRARSIMVIGTGIGLVLVTFWNESVGALVAANPQTLFDRFDQYHAALDALMANPVVGCGRACIFGVTDIAAPIHNYWLLVALYVGLLGLIFAIYPFVLAIRVGLSKLFVDSAAMRATGIMTVCVVAGASVELLLFPGANNTTGIFLGLLGVLLGVSPYTE